jgi:hypothetical protein
MHSTPQLLDAISEKHGGATDYRIAKLLGTSTSAVTSWRKGRAAFSLDYAHKVAELLSWDPAYVVACVEWERAEKDARLERTDEIKATWEKIAQRFKPAAAILAVWLLVALAPNQVVRADGGTASQCPSIHYAKRRRRSWIRDALHLIQSTLAPDRFAWGV